MSYPKFEGSNLKVEDSIKKASSDLLEYARQQGIDVTGSGLSHYIANLAMVMYDHENETYLDSVRGTIVLLQKARARVETNKDALIFILQKSKDLHNDGKNNGDDEISKGIELLAHINQKTKALPYKEADELIKELQHWLDKHYPKIV